MFNDCLGMVCRSTDGIKFGSNFFAARSTGRCDGSGSCKQPPLSSTLIQRCRVPIPLHPEASGPDPQRESPYKRHHELSSIDPQAMATHGATGARSNKKTLFIVQLWFVSSVLVPLVPFPSDVSTDVVDSFHVEIAPAKKNILKIAGNPPWLRPCHEVK